MGSTMGLLSLLPVLSLATVLASPGAQWTEEEALIVKSKLYSLFWNPSWAANWYLERHPELGMTEWPEKKSFPHAPKMLRLGFHQCFKWSDGTGGCNGCLNKHGMGLENRHNRTGDNEKGGNNPNSIRTNNAGLELTADILEEIFTSIDFPPNSMELPVSLAASGKSRADLWSFASSVAVEWGLDRNNKGCEGEDIWGDVAKGCLHLRAKEPDCKISGGETIPFYTGRSDCSADTGPGAWETERSESHPNPHGNGKMTADFFKNDFGLTARESAALLLGAHSFGTFNQQISQFKYDWTKNQASMLNNQLFRHVAMRPQYFLATPCRSSDPLVGDYLGQPAATRWRVSGLQCGTGGGPFQWFHQYYRCPASNDCTGIPQSDYLSSRFPEDNYPLDLEVKGRRALARAINITMRVEKDTTEGCCSENEANGWKCDPFNCQQRLQNDETALSVDVGYFLDFDVDPETGRPQGCPSFELKKSGGKVKKADWKNSAVVDCNKNSYAPEGEALSEIVEDFADNPNIWFKDFLTAYDKMSRTGYSDEELTQGPVTWIGAKCELKRIKRRGKVWQCV